MGSAGVSRGVPNTAGLHMTVPVWMHQRYLEVGRLVPARPEAMGRPSAISDFILMLKLKQRLCETEKVNARRESHKIKNLRQGLSC